MKLFEPGDNGDADGDVSMTGNGIAGVTGKRTFNALNVVTRGDEDVTVPMSVVSAPLNSPAPMNTKKSDPDPQS